MFWNAFCEMKLMIDCAEDSHHAWGDLPPVAAAVVSNFFFTLVAGPRRSLSLKLSDTRVYAPTPVCWRGQPLTRFRV